MEVPDHIYLHGQRNKENRHSVSIMNDMFVPEKIIVGEGGRLIPHPSQPVEVVRNKTVPVDVSDRVSPVPLKVTANDYPAENKYQSKRESGNSKFESQDSLNAADSLTHLNNSLAVDQDPIRELKNVRRQIGRLATRILVLEDENQRRAVREYGLWTLFTGSLVIIAYILGRK